MPTWTNRPPDSDREIALRIIRAPAKGQIIGLITTTNLIGCPTHFVNHRTLPHEEHNCTACLKGFPKRYHGYLGVLLSKTFEHTILEITKAASDTVADYRDATGELRGHQINAYRAAPRPNGRLIVHLQPYDTAHTALPNAPDLIACLSKIWGIPEAELRSQPQHPGINELIVAPDDPNGRLSQPIIHQ